MPPLRLLFSLAVAATPVLAQAPASAVQVTSFAAPEGRVLQHRVLLSATPAEVYAAFTTAEGLRAWAVPMVTVDLRVGGIWESAYSLTAKPGDAGNIKNRYAALVPNRLVAFQAIASPPGFPAPDLLRELVTVAELDSVGPGRTQLTLSMVGYRPLAGFDSLYQFFARGNAWSLEQLRERFEKGPVDWPARLGGRN